jgi:hypothetical protein
MVPGDRVEPRREARITAEGVETAKCPEEHLLGEIEPALRIRGIPATP